MFPTYRLKPLDIIKIGRVRFKVTEAVSRPYNEERKMNM